MFLKVFKMKILFVRPPRYRWAFHSEYSSFWQPLGFASMAAVLRKGIKGLNIKIIDCPTLRMGWKSTKNMILIEKPDILCIGEETVSVHEAFKLMHYTKRISPQTIIIGGGLYFTNMIADSLLNHPIDFIVKYEGEETLLELVKEIKKGGKGFNKIKGIAYLHGNKVIETQDRALIDMEKLPMPAYDLLPMRLYGSKSKSHKDFAAIEHSRGCTSSCNFCTLWKQMSYKGRPCYRTKSVEKTVAEVKHLVEKYGRKTLCWVDGTWNADSKWNLEFAKALIREGIKVEHSTWMRADYIVRDEKNEILEWQVKAGLRQAMIGVERTCEKDMEYLDKKNNSLETIKNAFGIFREKYPSVLTLATYIYGLPYETKETMHAFYDELGKIPFDIGVPLPFTPYPGTKYFDELRNNSLLEIKDFKYYNFINPIARSKSLSRNALIWNMLLNEFRIRTKREQFMHLRIDAKRRAVATKRLAWGKVVMTFRYFYGIILEELTGKVYNYNVKPRRYDK